MPTSPQSPQSAPRNSLTLLALLAYCAVMIALTMLKSFYRIGYLWDPADQRQQGVSWQIFGEFSRGDSWFAPLFGYLGNIAFFIPFGILMYTLVRKVSLAILAGLLLSIAMESAQYIFSLGFTDIDDVIMNTLGAAIGAAVAVASDKIFGPRVRWLWVILGITLGIIFAILVGLGERLGDPDKVVDV